MAAAIRAKAATATLGPDLASLAADALAKSPSDMSVGEIRQLAADAITQAQLVSFLLGKLAGLLDDEGGAHP